MTTGAQFSQGQMREQVGEQAGPPSVLYWQSEFERPVPVLDLPYDRPRIPQEDPRHESCEIAVSADVTDLLRTLAEQEQTTVFAVLIACFSSLLYRWTSQPEVAIACPVGSEAAFAGKHPSGLLDTLLVRVDVSGEPTLREVVRRAGDATQTACAQATVPRQTLEDIAGPGMLRLRQPQVAFGVRDEKLTAESHRTTGLVSQPPSASRGMAELELTLCPRSGGFVARLDYDGRVFDRSSAERMLWELETLLQSGLQQPDQPIARVPLLSPDARKRLLAFCHGATIPNPEHSAIHRMFETQARLAPAAVAVRRGDDSATYGDLNRRANQLAAYLRELGIGPDMRVGICMDRSIALVEAILAVLKAGGAYVPLDPAYPPDRLAYMLRDASVPLLLTCGDSASILPPHGAHVVAVDRIADRIASQPGDDPHWQPPPGSLAYVMYTSGSTGEPRGVMITHGNLCHYVNAIRIPLSVTAADVYLHTASFSFSSSARQLLVPLSLGATVVLATTPEIRDPLTLLEIVKREGTTVVDWVPSYWRSCVQVLQGIDAQRRQSILDNQLRLIVSASEPLLSDLPNIWCFEFRHRAELLNMFGQTETTGLVSCYPITPGKSEPTKVVSIGRPLANTSIYVLDPHGRPAPIGVIGELYIGGAGVGRGYLNKPQDTAERFVRSPLPEHQDARLYRTGDLARLRPDGNIEFLGRRDHLVKIRGVRVELGEIEAVLTQHESVRRAVVVATDDAGAERRLVAYVVAAEPRPEPIDLRAFLSRHLPDHMLPSAFVFLDALPLTPTGKVDRRALPRPGHSERRTAVPFERPHDLVEYHLTLIWEALLKVRPIGRDDDFFELGGHSLLAVEMLQRVAEAFQQRLPAATLVRGATIAHLADALRAGGDHDFRSLITPMQAGGAREPFFFLTGDYTTGGVYCRSLARHIGSDRPFFALRPHGMAGDVVPPTVEEMAASYLRAIREIKPDGPYLLGGYCNGGIVAYEIARQLRAGGEEVHALVMIETWARSVRFRHLHSFLYLLARLLKVHPYREAGWHKFIFYYELRFQAFRTVGLSQKVTILGRVIRNLIARVARPSSSDPASAMRSPTPGRLANSEDTAAVAGATHAALMRYIPRRHSGRLLLLQSEEAVASFGLEPTAGWRDVAQQLEYRAVPGDHVTCIIQHVAALAETIRAELDAVPQAVNTASWTERQVRA